MKNTAKAIKPLSIPVLRSIRTTFIFALYALTAALYACSKLVPNKAQLQRVAKYAVGIFMAVIAAIFFMLLLLRALDIEAEAQEMTLENHKQYLEIQLPYDAQ